MKEKELEKIFCENLEHFKKSINWLKFLMINVVKLNLTKDLTDWRKMK